MTRKVFKAHYIELIGCSSSSSLLRHSKHPVHPGELKLPSIPEESYGSNRDLWQVGKCRSRSPTEATSPGVLSPLGHTHTAPTS